jgi:uncharacterized protein YcnI
VAALRNGEATVAIVTARSLILGFVGEALAAAGHAAAGAPLPSPVVLVAAGLMASILVMPLLSRERGLVWTVGGLAACQALLHVVLSDVSHVGGHAPLAGARPSLVMLALHGAGVLVAAWWLRCADAAVWRRARRAVATVLQAHAARRGAPRGSAESFFSPLPPNRVERLLLRPLASCSSSRGPPPRTSTLHNQRNGGSTQMRRTVLLALVLAGLAFPASALAHVVVSPGEVVAGTSAVFEMRVPTEEPVPTKRIRLNIPEGVIVSGVEAVYGWKIKIIRQSGRIVALRWDGNLPPDYFQRFYFRARVPDEPTTLAWKAIQTYKNGKVVRWTGEPGEEEVSTTDVTPAPPGSGEED